MNDAAHDRSRLLGALREGVRDVEARLEADGGRLDETEAGLVGQLVRRGDLRVSDLGGELGCSPSTLTSILDRLERRGLVARSRNPADRRSFLVGVTEAGRDLAAARTAALRDLDEAVADRVGAVALEGFRAVMRALADAARR